MKKIREGYKMTELGEIPEKWYISKLDELAQIKRGASPRPINNSKWFSEKKNVGWIRISDVTKTKKYLNSTEQYLSDEGIAKSRLVKPNDLIMSICATVGKPIILNIDACIHDGFILFDNLNNSKIITEYLYYLLQKKEEEFKGMGQTGTQANLNTNIVGSTLIAIPTIEEQKKIALILSTVDEEINNVDSLIEKNKELKKGLMQTLLTKGIGHTKFKKTEIGEIPEEWDISELENKVEIRSGNSPSDFELCEDGKYPFFKVDDMNYTSKYLNVSKVYFNNCKYQLMEKGMVVFPKRGASIFTNKVAILGKRGYFDTNTMGLKCLDTLNNEYLFYQLKFIGLDKFADTTAVPQINNKHINPLIIPIPSLEEQYKIVVILSKVDERIEKYENKKQKLEELKKGLMQKLLTGSIRVV